MSQAKSCRPTAPVGPSINSSGLLMIADIPRNPLSGARAPVGPSINSSGFLDPLLPSPSKRTPLQIYPYSI